MNYYIATSRDGDSWDMRWVYAGQPFVPRGPDDAFDKDIVPPSLRGRIVQLRFQLRHAKLYSFQIGGV